MHGVEGTGRHGVLVCRARRFRSGCTAHTPSSPHRSLHPDPDYLLSSSLNGLDADGRALRAVWCAACRARRVEWGVSLPCRRLCLWSFPLTPLALILSLRSLPCSCTSSPRRSFLTACQPFRCPSRPLPFVRTLTHPSPRAPSTSATLRALFPASRPIWTTVSSALARM
ncbi:hypothetical protein C8R45DRAFT_190513 [Mycena sanguinolenta]|nr:hypothetical protein C8R45DRAFT_190513 [Mycena sanguinolenta]